MSSVETILTFFDGLPVQIREVLIPQVAAHFDEEAVMPEANPRAIIEARLKTGFPLGNLQGVTMVCGILDYAFGKPRSSNAFLEKLGGEIGSETLESLGRQAPLRDAFMDRAAKEWKKLRAGPLSYETRFREEVRVIGELAQRLPTL